MKDPIRILNIFHLMSSISLHVQYAYYLYHKLYILFTSYILYMSSDYVTTVRLRKETAETLREMSFDFRVRSVEQVVEKLIDEYQKSHTVEAPA